jgi:hypothetical protein
VARLDRTKRVDPAQLPRPVGPERFVRDIRLPTRAALVDYRHSGDVTGDDSSVVA